MELDEKELKKITRSYRNLELLIVGAEAMIKKLKEFSFGQVRGLVNGVTLSKEEK